MLLGEMRDLDSIQISLSLAETGHLVFATLHTNDAAQALDRIIDVFPSERRDQIQIMLAGALQGVISQRLLPSIGGGRVAAYEVMVANEAIRNLVREGKSRQMRNMISTGAGEGMQTIEMDLARLVAAGLITMETAMEVSQYPKEVQAQLATARAQMHAHATMASGQAGSSGSGTYGGAPVTPGGAAAAGSGRFVERRLSEQRSPWSSRRTRTRTSPGSRRVPAAGWCCLPGCPASPWPPRRRSCSASCSRCSTSGRRSRPRRSTSRWAGSRPRRVSTGHATTRRASTSAGRESPASRERRAVLRCRPRTAKRGRWSRG